MLKKKDNGCYEVKRSALNTALTVITILWVGSLVAVALFKYAWSAKKAFDMANEVPIVVARVDTAEAKIEILSIKVPEIEQRQNKFEEKIDTLNIRQVRHYERTQTKLTTIENLLNNR